MARIANRNLPNGFNTSQIADCLTSRRQELILLPTEKCNFRCTYCYEDFKVGRMKPDVVRGIKNFISKRGPELEVLNLSWFGGEPLIALPVVLDIARHAYAESSRSNFVLHGGFTTNGYTLTSALLDELVSINHAFFQISLDGWGLQHDKTRRRADGKGTFERIWRNLESFRSLQADFDIMLRVHVSHENEESLHELCQNIGKTFGQDNRFRVDFQDVRNMGGDGGKTVVSLDKESFHSKVTRLNQTIEESCAGERKTFVSEIEIDADPENPRPTSAPSGKGEKYICYASKPNSLLIRADGTIGKCTVALYDSRNKVGRIQEDGSLDIDNEFLRMWIRGFDDIDASTLSCPASKLPERLPRLKTKEGTSIAVSVVR